jgi:exodeoxyribonuclease-5
LADLTLSQLCTGAEAGDTVVLCASARLARHLREAHGRRQAARGLAQWQPLATATVGQWLGHVVGEAVLAGEIPAAAARRVALNAAQERLLWERVVAAGGSGAPEDALFDSAGLAQAAAAANELVEAWGIRPEAAALGEETQAFLRWREAFRAALEAADWLEPARHLEWQIGCIARGAGRMPRRVALAGFDRIHPPEGRLLRALEARGVAITELALVHAEAAAVVVVALPDAQAECRAAAAWAAQQLAENPAARVGIVVPELGALRPLLAAALDEALHPAAFNPAQAELPRRYDFSLGTPLAREPLVETALALIALAARPQRVEQVHFGELLHRPYWSVEGEADARDRFDAALRETLAPRIALERALRFARKCAAKGIVMPHTLAALEALQQAATAQPARQLPSQWALAFSTLTAAAGWPGERPLSSHEWQARNAFAETLDMLGQFDALLGRIACGEALRRLQQLCRERIFQPEAEGDPSILVMGLLEAVAEPLDGLWAMGMNDHAWPPAARPNPLLPAELQRRARTPGASSEVQAEFAATLQRRLLHSAPQAVFSWAQREAGRELRPSPLLAGLPAADAGQFAVPAGLVEQLAGNADIVRLDDAQAPPVAAGEHVRGGTGLLKAQAVCPAWAFYQYRLGARALGAPVEGLDPAARGTLLHGVLEHFWRGRAAQDLAALDDAASAAAVGAAADAALAAFNRELDEPLSPRFAALERERLIRLVLLWLGFERARPVPFRVVACEQAVDIEIEGIAVHLVVDRIDELADGRHLVIDYKTAATVSAKSWNDERIAEPQLPVYAALAATGEIAGAAFAQVRAEKCAFVGIAAEGGLLPNVAGIGDDKAGRLFPAIVSWDALLTHWRSSIATIAREVREGVAAVCVSDEAALAYCEVKPLLRLAEARAQQEATT